MLGKKNKKNKKNQVTKNYKSKINTLSIKLLNFNLNQLIQIVDRGEKNTRRSGTRKVNFK